ncbi:hypothetical protein ACM61V_04580 [Sphingomonas sp. TX0543]|uniref:hypothetical protein n=1 Tax=Sphingomonas sp. TX0543 TaxID=3399682 RepID=UPI003AFACCF7
MTERLLIDAVDFQIACRRFTIRATVTRDRQLGVVDEYVLRLLAVLDRMSVSRLRAWFGFSEAEMETVLLDLGERRSWIEFDGDEVLLAPAGRELFRSVGSDGVPHIVEVAPLIGDVWFDLVSRSMVPRSRARNTDYLVRLREQPSARELPEAFAREAFEENFRDYARRIRRFPDADAVNLYSISDIHGGSYGYQVLPAALALDLDKLVVRPTFPDLEDGAGGFQKLTVAANDAWQGLSVPDAAPTTAAEFERMTGETKLADVIRSPASQEAWRAALQPDPVSGFKPTIGATYLPENASPFIDTVGDGDLPQGTIEIVWLRPSGSAWGRTLKVAETLHGLREALRNSGVDTVATTIAMPRSTHKSIRASHRRLFERGALLPQGRLPANMEILLVTGVAAFVNVHVPLSGHGVPVGGIVTDPKRLARIADRLNPSPEEGAEALWTDAPAHPAG